MPKFVFAYHGGKKPETPEEGAQVMQAWTDWFAGMGSAVVDGGNPVDPSQTVSASIGKAVEMAQGCPILAIGGSVEVAEAMEM